MKNEHGKRSLAAVIKRSVRDVLAEEACVQRLMETVMARGPVFPESERLLVGSLLAGDSRPGELLPCVAMDMSVPLHRAAFLGCCAFPAEGNQNTRIAKIVLALEADGHVGVRDSIDTLLEWREYYRGEDVRPHIRAVHQAGCSRRMAQYLERLAEDLRGNRITTLQAEASLARKLQEDDGSHSRVSVVPARRGSRG